MILALVTAYFRVADVRPSSALARLDQKLIGRFAVVGVCFLVGVKVFISVFAHYG